MNQKWKAFAIEIMRTLAATREQFTADDVHDALDSHPEPKPSGDIRFVFGRAERMKIIQRTGRFERSRRKIQHGRHLRVWEPYSDGPRAVYEHPVDELAERMMVTLQRRDPTVAYREVARHLYETLNPAR